LRPPADIVLKNEVILASGMASGKVSNLNPLCRVAKSADLKKKHNLDHIDIIAFMEAHAS
jgi:hypothetical protein